MSNAQFWDKVSRKYAADPIKDLQAYYDTLDRARDVLQDTDHVLEIGCGTGTTALLLADDVAQITATDISTGMLEIAEEKRIAQEVENVRFIQSGAAQPR